MASAERTTDGYSLWSMHDRKTGRSYTFLKCLMFSNWRIGLSTTCSHWTRMSGTLLTSCQRWQEPAREGDILLPRKTPPAGKLMSTLLWDYKGQILEHYISWETTINCEAYCDLLETQLKPANSWKCSELFNSGVLLQHYHTAHAAARHITNLRLVCLSYPTHLPDLTARDCQVFSPSRRPSVSSVRTKRLTRSW